MGGKAKSFEDEALDALNSVGDDEALAAEAGAVLRPVDAIGRGESMPVQNVVGDPARGNFTPEMAKQLDSLQGTPYQDPADQYFQFLTDPSSFAKGLGRIGTNYLTGAAGALGPEGSVIGNAAVQGGAAAANRFTQDKLNDVGTLEALVNSGWDGLKAGGLALGLGGAASLAQGGSDRARVAAFNADKGDLQQLGVTPREFAQRTDELGLNNPRMPMDAADKRARIAEVLADRGAKHDAAIAAADASNPLAGRNLNQEIAQDIDMNADRVRTGRSGEREGIINAMGRTANAVEQGDPIDSLKELGAYRTQQGTRAFGRFGSLPEEAAGKAALAGYDSADQHLIEAMRQSGDANFQQFTAADADFHDAKLLEELTNQAPPSNPWRRAIGAGVGAAVGAVTGGGYPGMVAGAAIGDMTRGYHADAMANLGQGAATSLGIASQMTGGAVSAAEQLKQSAGQSRGQQQPDVVESWLNSGDPRLQPWAAQLQQAQENGTLDQELTKLRQTDKRWQAQVLPQLQMSTAQGAQ